MGVAVMAGFEEIEHLEANPYVSCSYWSPKHETAHVECRTSWADDQRLDPWRVMILTAEDAAAGRFYERVWRA
jgi:hypothetical protein